MKKMNYVKFVLDVVMAIGFLLLLKPDFLGIAVHERAGLLIAMMVLVHLGINNKMIKVLSSKLFNQKVPLKIRSGFLIDLVLFGCLILIIFSGVGISMTLFTEIQLSSRHFWKDAHEVVSYVAIALLIIHGLLHWNWFKAIMNGIIGVAQLPKGPLIIFYGLVLLIISSAMVAYGVSDLTFAQRETYGKYNTQLVIGEGKTIPSSMSNKKFTSDELARYDGENGNAAYVAIDGIVYDVSNCFNQGHHYTVMAGMDISQEFYEEHRINILRRSTIVGIMQEDSLDVTDGVSTSITDDSGNVTSEEELNSSEEIVGNGHHGDHEQRRECWGKNHGYDVVEYDDEDDWGDHGERKHKQ